MTFFGRMFIGYEGRVFNSVGAGAQVKIGEYTVPAGQVWIASVAGTVTGGRWSKIQCDDRFTIHSPWATSENFGTADRRGFLVALGGETVSVYSMNVGSSSSLQATVFLYKFNNLARAE